ncbi:Phage integrase family protein [Azospirillaceae bacterium]
MNIRVPYLVIKPGAGGTTRYFWQPSAELRALGWRSERLRHPDGRAAGTLDEALELAKQRNAALDGWRQGGAAADGVPAAKLPEIGAGTVAHMIRLYKASPRYTSKAEKTRRDYAYNLGLIEAWAGDAPVKEITREVVQDYYETLMASGKHAKANAVLRVLRILLKYAWDNGHASQNAAEKPGLISTAPRLRIWSEAEISAFVKAADAAGWPSLGDAVVYGVYLGQRQGDLLRLLALNVQPDGDGFRILLRQAKRGSRVSVPLHPRAAARYRASLIRRTAEKTKAATVLWHEQTGKPWVAYTFRHLFAEIRTVAAVDCPSLVDVWFMDTRDTAVTQLAQAGCTIPEICAITGHEEGSAYQVLKHYLALNGEMADSAIRKLVVWDEQKRAKSSTNRLPNLDIQV